MSKRKTSRAQRHIRSRCACGKRVYSRYSLATKVAGRLYGEAHVYYCPRSGAFHISQSARHEYDRRRAAYLQGEL